jgi:hypothetical protein
MRHAEANSASARSHTKGSACATERRGCCAEATAAETTSASNWSSPAAPADDMATTTEASSHSSSTVITTTLRLPDQGRARKQRDPIEFSFHDLDFICVVVFEFIV